MEIYALDIGGSSVKHAILTVNGGTPLIRDRFKSLRLRTNSFSGLRDGVLKTTGEVLARFPDISTVAISTTGNVDQHGTVRRAGHFDGYENVSWKEILRTKFSDLVNVITVNDGKASTWAEFWPLRSECETFAHVVVGTGIGGGLVINGVLLYGDQGSAGSFGHIKVATNSDVQCSCTRTGCVETLASGPAIVQTFNRFSQGQCIADSLEEVTSYAEKGDANAIKSIVHAGRFLGIALSNVMNIVNPQIITIGGGVVLAVDSIRDDGNENLLVKTVARNAGSSALVRVASATTIRRAQHGNDGGLIGAALLAKEA